MKKAKIYIPSKSAMQSGKGKSNKWLLEFNKSKTENDHLMNWVSSNDTQSQVKLFFSSKDEAIAYAKKIILILKLLNQKK